MPLVSLKPESFLSVVLFFTSLPFLNRTGQLSYGVSLSLHLSDGASWLDSGLTFGSSDTKLIVFLVRYTSRHTVLLCPTDGYVSLSYLIKVESAVFLCLKFINFP